MSRVGKSPVAIPEGVTVDVVGQLVTAKGKLGELSLTLVNEIEVAREDNQISVTAKDDTITARKMWGTTRANINNLVVGVSEGFKKDLEITGVGYRAQLKGKELVLQLGFSHDVNFQIPDGIEIKCADQTHISVSGIDKQKVGQTAAVIRSYRPPEPYKGKGVRYAGEYIIRKEGKKK